MLWIMKMFVSIWESQSLNHKSTVSCSKSRKNLYYQSDGTNSSMWCGVNGKSALRDPSGKEDIKTAEVESLGSVLEQHERFQSAPILVLCRWLIEIHCIYGYLNVVLEKLKLVEAVPVPLSRCKDLPRFIR